MTVLLAFVFIQPRTVLAVLCTVSRRFCSEALLKVFAASRTDYFRRLTAVTRVMSERAVVLETTEYTE